MTYVGDRDQALEGLVYLVKIKTDMVQVFKCINFLSFSTSAKRKAVGIS